MNAFKNNPGTQLNKFEVGAIANSKFELALPGGKAYISEDTRDGKTTVMAWVSLLGMTIAMKLDETRSGKVIVRVRASEVNEATGEISTRYRRVPELQEAAILLEAYQGPNMEAPLPKGMVKFFVSFQDIGEAIAQGLRDGLEVPIDFAAYGITPTSQAEIDARREAARARYAQAALAATDATATEKPKTRQRAPRGLKTASEKTAEPVTVAAEVPVENSADMDYDPFAGQ